MKSTSSRIAVVLMLCLALNVPGQAESESPAQRISIGFFEGGTYPIHEIFRDAFRKQLNALIPAEYEAIYIPDGFKSAGWNRDTSRAMAAELASLEELDIVVTLGPWVVEDLLASGFDKPIIATNRFAPDYEGLLDSGGRPVEDNLTVTVRPGRLDADLRLIAGVVRPKKLAFLYFPSGSESDRVTEVVKEICDMNGIELVVPTGFDNKGTYAYFKAYRQIGKDVDAVYTSSLYGLDGSMARSFFEQAFRDKLAVFNPDGPFFVGRGALLSNGSASMLGAAHFSAAKAVQIVKGAIPADLPVEYAPEQYISINEKTARRCRVAIPETMRINSEVVSASDDPNAVELNLADAIFQARAVNPGYLARYEAMRTASHTARQAASTYLPHVSSSALYRNVDDNTVHNLGGTIDNNLFRAQIDLKQLLLSLPAINTIKLAGEESDRQTVLLDSAGLDLELAVTSAYLNYLKSEEVLTALKEHRRRIDNFIEIAGAAEQQGASRPGEKLRWSTEKLEITRQIVTFEYNLKVARMLFNLLLNQPGDTPVLLDRNVASTDRFIREFVVLEKYFGTTANADNTTNLLIGAALNSNPSVRAARHLESLARMRITGNTYRYLPTIGFQATLKFQDELVARNRFFEEKSTTWSLGALIEVPIFEGLDRVYERSRLKSRLEQVEYSSENTKLEVIGNVRSAAYDLSRALTNTPLAAENEDGTRTYLEITGEHYTGNHNMYRISKIDVLDALSTHIRTRIDAILERYAYFESASKLLRAIGMSVDGSQSPATILSGQLAESTTE